MAIQVMGTVGFEIGRFSVNLRLGRGRGPNSTLLDLLDTDEAVRVLLRDVG